MIAYNFVNREIDPVEKQSGTLHFVIKQKLLDGKKLTRYEKDVLVERMKGENYIKYLGWFFSYRDYMTQYIVKQHGSWHEYWAFDKTSLKKILIGRPDQILIGYQPEKK